MDFERLLAAKAVDFVQPSPAKMGGISECAKSSRLRPFTNPGDCRTPSTTAQAYWRRSMQPRRSVPPTP